MLHIPLPLPRRAHIIVVFRKHEAPQSVLLGETLDNTGAMVPHTPGEVVCYADIQRAIGFVIMYTHPGMKALFWKTRRP